MQGTAVTAAEPIENRQQGQADSRLRGRGDDAAGELARPVVGHAARLMVNVVKLGDRGEAGLEHLHLGEGGDRLHLVRAEPVEEAVHQLAPGPEAVAGIGAPPFGQAGHRALKRVTVQIDRRRQEYADAPPSRRGPGLDRGDSAVSGNLHPHLALPARGRQRLLGPERFHFRHRPPDSSCGCDLAI